MTEPTRDEPVAIEREMAAPDFPPGGDRVSPDEFRAQIKRVSDQTVSAVGSASPTRDERPGRDAVATIYYRNSVGEELKWNVAAVLGADDPESLEGLLKRWRPDCKFLGATIEATGWERKWEAEERAEKAERALDELRAAVLALLEAGERRKAAVKHSGWTRGTMDQRRTSHLLKLDQANTQVDNALARLSALARGKDQDR